MNLEPREIRRLQLSAFIGATIVGSVSALLRTVDPAYAATSPRRSLPTVSQSGGGSAASVGQSGGVTGNANAPCSAVGDAHVDCSRHDKVVRILPANFDRIILTPGRISTPGSKCFPGLSSYRVVLGGNEAKVNSDRPSDLISIDGRSIVQAAVRPDGIHLTRLILFDEFGKVIVDVTDNSVWIKPGYEAEKIGLNGVVILDDQANEMFRLTIPNKRVIRISGIFHFPSSDEMMVATDDKLLVRNPYHVLATLIGVCVDHNLFTFGNKAK